MTAGDSARSATGGLTSAARDARELVSGPAGGLVVHAHIPADHSTRAASAAAARAPGFVVHVRIPAERKRAMVESGAVGERRAVGEDRAAGATGPGRASKGRGRAAKTPESAAVRAVFVIRVVLLDDEELVRSGIAMILEAGGGIEVVAQGGDGRDIVDLVAKHRPDVVVTDIRMPHMDGLEVTRRVRALPDPPAVVVLTTFGLDEYVYAALEAGAAGFLLKDTPPRELAHGVEVVARGDAILAPAITKRMLTAFATGAQQPEARAQLEQLTEREGEVALAVATGAGNAEIARTLHMSESTVKVHISRIIAKLGLENRTQIAILVHRAGLA